MKDKPESFPTSAAPPDVAAGSSDSDVRKTAFSDIRKGAEQRRYEVRRQDLEFPSNITIYFDCPWCGNEVKAYLWSLSGGGKRCSCGAIFGSGSRGYKLPPSLIKLDKKESRP